MASIVTSFSPASAVFGGFPACGEDLQPHVAARFGPFVVLLGQYRAGEADNGLAGGEDADDAGPAPGPLFRRSWGLLDQIWRQIPRGKAAKASRSSRASSRWAAAGNLASRVVTTWACWARTEAAPGCSKMVRTRGDTH